MAEIVIRPEAVDDITYIHLHGAAEFGLPVADQYHDGLEAAIMRLADFPESGPVYPGLRPPIRFLTFRSHHIFYDYDGQTVWIVRILHHAQDVYSQF